MRRVSQERVRDIPSRFMPTLRVASDQPACPSDCNQPDCVPHHDLCLYEVYIHIRGSPLPPSSGGRLRISPVQDMTVTYSSSGTDVSAIPLYHRKNILPYTDYGTNNDHCLTQQEYCCTC